MQEIRNIFYNTIDLMSKPKVFDDPIALAEYDKHHIGLYEADVSMFQYRRDWPSFIYIK